jgi:hypothetical protein
MEIPLTHTTSDDDTDLGSPVSSCDTGREGPKGANGAGWDSLLYDSGSIDVPFCGPEQATADNKVCVFCETR